MPTVSGFALAPALPLASSEEDEGLLWAHPARAGKASTATARAPAAQRRRPAGPRARGRAGVSADVGRALRGRRTIASPREEGRRAEHRNRLRRRRIMLTALDGCQGFHPSERSETANDCG